MAKKPQISYHLPDWVYTPVGLSKADDELVKEARHEYQRLRRAAQKRLARFPAAGFENTATYRKYGTKDYFPKSSEIASTRILAYRLTELRDLLESDQGSIAGQRELKTERQKTLETLHKHNYYFVNESNYDEFILFMDAARIKAGGKLKASDRVAELFQAAEKKNIPPEELLKDFDYWITNKNELERSHRKKSGKPHSAEDYKKTIETRKKRIARERRKEG